MIFLAIIFVIATLSSLAGGRLVRHLATSAGAVIPPRPDRWHSSPTPTMGGVAIASATLIGFAAIVFRPDLAGAPLDWLPALLAALAMFVVGVVDDQLQLSPVAKLVSSLAIGAFLVFVLSGAGAADEEPSVINALIATIWFAGICHAVNLLDNMDGLAAGTGLIAALFLAGLLPGTLGPAMVVLLVALSGALLGFLYWNRNRARLFMGDCGSLFIGGLLGAGSLVPIYNSSIAFVHPAIIVALVLVVPLFDTGFVLVLRRLAGLPATRGGTDHVSHRLVSLGFSERSAVRILYLLGAAGGGSAWLLQRYIGEPMLPLVALFVVTVGLLGIYLARVPAYDAEDFKALQKSSFAPFLKDLAFRWHAAEVLLDVILITVCYYLAYRIRFEGESLDNFLPYFAASLPGVLGCKLAALYASGLYQRSWVTFGLRDVTAVTRGVGFGSLLAVLFSVYVNRLVGFSRAVFVLDALLFATAIVATRASFRAMNLVAATRNKKSRRVLIYGAGAFGQTLVREMRSNPLWNMNPIAFLDDDPMKARRWITGVPVRGNIEDLESTVREYGIDEVVLSSRSINGSVEHRIRDICGRLDLEVRRLHMEIS